MTRRYIQWHLLFLLIVPTVAAAWTTPITIHPAEHQRRTTCLYSSDPRLLIVGYGRVGKQVAQLASKQRKDDGSSPFFWKQIVGTVREEATAPSIYDDDDAHSAISCIPISKLQDELLHSNYSHVLIAMPPVQEIYQTILEYSGNAQWLGMVSTTGVYGNHHGEWVTEESELRYDQKEEEEASLSSRSQYVQWERAFFHQSTFGNKVRIFRCAGIYDSTRSALHTLWKKKASSSSFNASPKSTKEFKTNRIHVADIGHAIVQSMMLSQKNNQPFEIYNLADDLPERRSKVMEYASDLLTKRLGKDWMTSRKSSTLQTKTNNQRRRRRREQEPKLIDNQKLKRTLLATLQYPTYKEGLDAILVDPQAPWNKM